MEDSIVAKNLLSQQTCENCTYRKRIYGLIVIGINDTHRCSSLLRARNEYNARHINKKEFKSFKTIGIPFDDLCTCEHWLPDDTFMEEAWRKHGGSMEEAEVAKNLLVGYDCTRCVAWYYSGSIHGCRHNESFDKNNWLASTANKTPCGLFRAATASDIMMGEG